MREHRAHLPLATGHPVGERLAEGAAGALLVAALVFGGGSRGVGDLVVHGVALIALALGVMRWRTLHATRSQRLFLGWLFAAMALLLLQLVPLPVSLFVALPPRAEVVADLRQAGIEPAWLPMTLDVWGTVRALLAVMTLAAAWLLTSTLGTEARIRLLRLVLVSGVLMTLVGFAQAAAGEHSPLRPHHYHHTVGAIGSFANRNHFADLMAMLIPLALAFAFAAQALRRQAHAAIWYAAALLLFLASALSFSRAGMMLTAVVTVFTSAYLAWSTRNRGGRGAYFLPALAIVLAASGVAAYAWGGIATRLALDPLNDLRWQYLHYGIEAARAYLPWGSGAGSFRDVYAPFEPVVAMQPVYALHAHNDVLEVAVELGLPGLLLVLSLLALLIHAVWRALKNGEERRTSTIIPAAAVAVLVPLTHSFVDYPLRTLAVTTVFATLLAVLMAAPAQRVE